MSIDYIQFRSATMKAVIKILERRPLSSLGIRTFADLVGISWNFERKLSEEEKDKIRQTSGLFRNEHKLRFGYMKEKNFYCIKNRLVKHSGTFEFTVLIGVEY